MAQFQIPQFIEVEDKIFGPLTLKQFIYVAGGAGISFVLYRTLPLLIAMPFIAGIGGLSIALAFYKVNNRPFVVMLESAVMYIVNSRLYLWEPNHAKKKQKQNKVESAPLSAIQVPNLSEHKLKSLAWSLDINEKITNNPQPQAQTRRTLPNALRTIDGDIANISYNK